MIQRRQTLYLLLVAILSVLLIRLDPPFYRETGIVKAEDGSLLSQNIDVHFNGTYSNSELIGKNRGLSSLLWACGILALVSIFLFKNRKQQLWVVRLLMVIVLAVFANMYWYSLNMHYTETDRIKSFLPAAISPVALLLFNLLAQRGIAMDERLVRSLDRLR